jgi:hypothetical protein
MTIRKASIVAVMAIAASFSNFASAGSCVLTNQSFSLSTQNAYEGQSVGVTYGADRQSCAGVGTFSYKVNVGNSSGLLLGACEGSRSIQREDCSSNFDLPQGFVGELKVNLNGQTKTINVAPALVNPVVTEKAITTDEDVPVEIELAVEDELFPIYEIVALNDIKSGSVSISGTKFIYIPAANWNGVAEIAYRAIDVNGVPSADALINVDVKPVPDKPTLIQSVFLGAEDGVLTAYPKVVDPDLGDSYNLILVTQPPVEAGSVSASGAKIVFTPAPNWFGETSFSVKAVDSFGLESRPQAYKIILDSKNDDPVIAPVTLMLNEDSVYVFDATYSDSDGEGPYSVSISLQPNSSYGVCSVIGQKVQFIPEKDWNGTAKCEVSVADSLGGMGKALMTFVVNPVNDVPVPQEKQITLTQGVSGSVALTVVDPDLGNTHTYSFQDPADASFGFMSIENSNLTITPAPSFYGTRKIALKVADNAGSVSDVFYVYAKVIPVNGSPVLQGKTFFISKNNSYTVQIGATDPNNDSPIAYSLFAQASPTQGVASLAGNKITFSPATGYIGLAQVSVVARDPGGLESTPAVMKFNVEDKLVVATDPDVPDSHSVVIVTQPPAGEGSVSAAGDTVTLNPVAGYYGSSTFTYKVVDEAGTESSVVTGQIVVDKFNYAPSSATAVMTAIEGMASFSVTPTVVDANPYDAGLHSFVVPIQATTGFAEVVNNKLVYTAAYNFSGVEKFKFLAVDPGGLSVVGEATVTVKPLNYAPTSIYGSASGFEGEPVSANMVVKDPNSGDAFTYQILSQVEGGTASLTGSDMVFTPDLGFIGTVKVPVKVTDSGGLSLIGEISFKTTKKNFAPTSLSGSIKIKENSISTPYYPRIADVNIYDAGLHTLEIVTQPASGSAVLSGNKIILTPTPDFVGADAFTVKGTDTYGESITGTINIEVERVNNAPTSSVLNIYTLENTPSNAVFPVVADVNKWDQFSYEIVSQPAHGSVVITDLGFIYTPENAFYGADGFAVRTVDLGGEYLETSAFVYVAKKNFPPTGFNPGEVRFYEGVGGTFLMNAIDPNKWGAHTFKIIQQPEHGEIWVNGRSLVYRTTGTTASQAIVRVTDQDGEFFEAPLILTPRPVADLIDTLPVVDLPDAAIKAPASTRAYIRANGMPGFIVTDPVVLAALGTEWVAILDSSSEVSVNLSGKQLTPSAGIRFVVEYLSPAAIGTSLSAVTQGKAGSAAIKIARLDGTGNAYRIPVSVWSPAAAFTFSANPAVQLIDRVLAELVPSNADCAFSVKDVIAKAGNPYDTPICLVEFTQRPAEVKIISSDSSLAFLGPIETVGAQKVTAAAYIVTSTGEKDLVASYSQDLQVNPITDSVQMAPKYPFTSAYYQVEGLDLEFKQSVGPVCDLTVVDYIAKNSAASYSIRPMCLVEWTEIPIGLSARQNWDRPYLLGSLQYLGANGVKWKLSIYSPLGNKTLIGEGAFNFESVVPPDVAFSYDSKTSKLKEGLFSSYISGQYVGEATISSAAAKLNLVHEFSEGVSLAEDIAAGFGAIQETSRRINVAPFDSLWETRIIKASAYYSALTDSKVDSSISVVSIPDQNVMPIIDNENQRILSTDQLEVTVNIGDVYDANSVYSTSKMGEWEIRLVTKPTWKTYDAITAWEATDSVGQSVFDIDLSAMTGKNIRIYAEARPISPIPEYQEHRYSPKPLSLAILNGAALDGTVRALRMTGEAPLRVTFFADVANRLWTRDLGDVRWEVATESGDWETVTNPSRSPQRLAQTFQKGKYKVRAELTNKNSGLKSMTEEIEIIAYSVPKGIMKGPGNTFLDAPAVFKILQVDGQPQDLSNLDIQWSYDRGETWEDGTDAITQMRSTEQRVYIYARMKYKDSPEGDTRIWKRLRGGVAFRKVRPPRVQLIGPRRPEVGVEAVWVANMLMPYPSMDLTMNGEFIMPSGGAIVPGQEVRYTPTDDDLALEKTDIQYRAWIDGYRDKGGEGITTQRITFWLYDWPQWAIQPTFSSEYAPADLTMRVRNIGEFKGVESVTFNWEIPSAPGYTIVKDDNMALRILNITKPDTYTFLVHVYDARGNYSLVEREMTFKEPPPWDVGLAWTGNNRAHRAPMGVLIRPYISGGHPKDSISSMVYRLNGEPIITGGSRYARANLPIEGVYAMSLDIETTMGNVASGNIEIEVKDNVPPTCELDVKEGGTAWTASAKCVDTDGRIARHHWYLNDALQGLGGSVITISKRTYTEPPHITLIAVDDSGEESPAVLW